MTTAASIAHTASSLELMGQPLTLRRGGAGPALVLLPHDCGSDGTR